MWKPNFLFWKRKEEVWGLGIPIQFGSCGSEFPTEYFTIS